MKIINKRKNGKNIGFVDDIDHINSIRSCYDSMPYPQPRVYGDEICKPDLAFCLRRAEAFCRIGSRGIITSKLWYALATKMVRR